jgi:hypothetical protein
MKGKEDMPRRAGRQYNPWYNILVKQGTGTLMYQGSWNLFETRFCLPPIC